MAEGGVWWATARSLLGVIEDGYAERGVELPERRYVSAGPPPGDAVGGLLTVHLERTFSYTTFPNELATALVNVGRGMAAVRGATFVVTLYRPVPMPEGGGAEGYGEVELPSVEREEDAAMLIIGDADHLLKIVAEAVVAGTEIGGCAQSSIGGYQNLAPQGGLGGGTLRVTLGRL